MKRLPQELNKSNESLIVPVSEADVLHKLDDIRRHPSMYSHLFDKPIPTGPNSIAGASELSSAGNTLEDPPALDHEDFPVNEK